MIEQTSFLGMPLKTQKQRRLLVALYYAVLISFAVAGLWMDKKSWGPLAAQTFVVGGMLGGIKRGGPVKVYEEPTFPLSTDDTMSTLNLAGRRPFDTTLEFGPLDERERMERDAAHYTAYRLLRVSFCLFVLGYFVVTWLAPLWLADKTLFVLWLFLLYVLSLPQAVVLWTEPQAVVLWTEPQAPAAELAAVWAGAR